VELTADTTQLGVDGEVSYLWQSKSPDGDYEPIEGAAGGTYTPSADDLGKYIKVIVTLAGYTGSAESETAEPVKPNVRSVTVSGPASLSKGMGAAYSAALEVIPDLDEYKGFEWSIDAPGKHDDTGIDEQGVLTIAVGETLSEITVIAASVSDPSVSEPFPVKITPAMTSEGKTVTGFKGSAIAFGDGVFVAAGGGKAAYSTDGVNWADVKPSESLNNLIINAIAYGEVTNEEGQTHGRFVAVCGSGRIAYSDDSGASWTLLENTALRGTDLHSIAYGEVTNDEGQTRGRFVAVGKQRTIAYSDDGGVSWTKVSNLNTVFGDFLTVVSSIAYGDGKFVAVASTGKSAYSDDGVSWTPAGDNTFDGSPISAIAFGGEGVNAKFVAGNYFGKMAWSTDGGVSWTKVNDTKFGSSAPVNAIAFGGGHFVAVAADGNIAYSADGVIWTADTGIPGSSGIAYGLGKFVTLSVDANNTKLLSFTF
jgi:hypothetical protein